jgi:hypothetical protein
MTNSGQPAQWTGRLSLFSSLSAGLSGICRKNPALSASPSGNAPIRLIAQVFLIRPLAQNSKKKTELAFRVL